MHADLYPPLDPSRPGDGVLILIQNNESKTLTVCAINEVIEASLGYASGEILGQPFASLLGKTLASELAADLEYDAAAPDFGEIFSRIRQVTLRRKTGEEMKVSLATTRLMAQDRHARFQLVIPSEHKQREAARLREFIALNLEGRAQLDAATGLPNRATALQFLPLLRHYASDASPGIVVAVLKLDRFDKSRARYGDAACVDLVKHAEQLCRSTFRSHDVVFALSPDTLGLVLFDINRETARVVLNRFRWKVKSQRFAFGDKPDFSISISIGFDMLDPEHSDGVLERCEALMANLDHAERSALVEPETA